MKTAIVIGAGIAGLSAALALHQRGFVPLLVDQDDAPPPLDSNPHDWPRRGAPQVRHPHFFMGRLLKLLQTRHPQLVDAMLAAGAWQMPFASTIHPAARGRYKPEPGDKELTALVARRTTFELVMQQYARDIGVAILSHTKVTSLLFAPSMQGVTVRGVRIVDLHAKAENNAVGLRLDGREDDGSRELVADVVIDASGRRGGFGEQLRAAGAKLSDEYHDSRLIYFTRHYQFRSDVERPDTEGMVALEFADYTVGALPADNGHFTVTIAPTSDNEAMKRGLRHVEYFERICHAVAPINTWMNRATAAPVSDIYAFGAMDFFWRTTVADGAPQVRGLYFIGDTVVRTNPKYGRGCTWSCEQAHALADLLALSLSPDETTIRFAAWLRECFRADWETMLQLDRGSRAKYERFTHGAASLGERIVGACNDAFADDGMKTAMLLDPVVQRAIMTGYHGLAQMDAWTKRPTIWLRVLWAWLTHARWRIVLEPYRTRATPE